MGDEARSLVDRGLAVDLATARAIVRRSDDEAWKLKLAARDVEAERLVKEGVASNLTMARELVKHEPRRHQRVDDGKPGGNRPRSHPGQRNS